MKMKVLTQVHPDDPHGEHKKYIFDNGTQMSAIKTYFSYGGSQGLWEIAAIDRAGNFITKDVWHDVYDDVLGNVSEQLLDKYADDVYYWDLEENNDA